MLIDDSNKITTNTDIKTTPLLLLVYIAYIRFDYPLIVKIINLKSTLINVGIFLMQFHQLAKSYAIFDHARSKIQIFNIFD